MALDCEEVRVGLTGHLYTAPVGTDMPDDTATALPSPWVELGYTTEDGLSMSIDTSKEDFRVWQSNSPCRSIVTEQTYTTTFTLVQRNAATLKLAFGGGEVVAGTAAGDFIYTPPSMGLSEAAFVYEVIDDDIVDRYLLYRGNPALTGEINFQKGEMTGYEIEVTHLNSADGVWKLISNDPALDPAATVMAMSSAVPEPGADEGAVEPEDESETGQGGGSALVGELV